MNKYYKKIVKTYKSGQIIFSENSECDGMYYIMEGRVRIFKEIATKRGEIKQLELVQLGQGSLFGEMAIVDNKKRSATVQAIFETRCMVITKTMFQLQMQRLPPWVTNLIQILVTRLRETDENLRKKAQLYEDDTGSVIYVDHVKNSDIGKMLGNLERSIETPPTDPDMDAFNASIDKIINEM